MSDKNYMEIITNNETYLDRFGDSYLGVGWTRTQADADKRYQIMLDLIRQVDGRVSLLDFGCGASHLYEYIQQKQLHQIDYSGLDLSRKFLELSRSKFPAITYYEIDVLDSCDDLPSFDYAVMFGVFTSKRSLTFDEMFAYFRSLVKAVFAKCRVGLAFNTISKQVDWERDDLFHLPFDVLAEFLTKEVSRHFVIRHEYGQYEYSAYIYRNAT